MTAPSRTPEITAHYRDEFDAFVRGEAEGDAEGLRALRREAIERFADQGFPSRKDEDWRYTNLRPIERAAFSRAVRSEPAQGQTTRAEDARAEPVFGPDDLAPWLPAQPLGPRLVFVDGRFDARLSDAIDVAGLTITRLADVRGDDEALEAWLSAGDTDESDDAFTCLNAAFVEDAALITIQRDAQIEAPLHLLFVASDAREASYPRVEIVAERGSRCVVVQDHVAVGRAAGFTDAVTRIEVEANASLDHVLVQREGGERFHISNTRVRQARDSRFYSHVLSFDGRLVRNALEAWLNEPGAEARLDGAFIGGGEQHLENQTLVVHEAPHCESHELYKGVLGGRSRGVFRGRVDVRPDAQKTNATQSNPNLLVTDRAEIDTKPQLEIRADDVKCSHGSTVGRLDEDALFFLRARGLDEPSARALLTEGFAAEVTGRLPTRALDEWATGLLSARLHGENGALAGGDA